MKILLLEDSQEIKIEYLKYLEKNNKIIQFWEEYKSSEIDVIIIRSKIKVNTELLDIFSNLKVIARVWVGLDKVDTEECKKRNIKILNTPWVNADSVADLVLAWTLTLTRKLNKTFSWIENRFEYMWNQISEKFVWIIGFWNIWKKVYNRLKSFWVKKFYIFDPFLKKEEVEKNNFCIYIDNKNEIFNKSDIISFHIPLIPQTKNFLWKEEFKLLKKDVLLVNTSRGWIVNEDILIKFLKENKNSNFFADVWEEENNLKNPKRELLELENCIITPHIWAMTKQAEEKMHYFEDLI